MWRNFLLVTESAAAGCLATTNASGAQPPERFEKNEKAARLAFSTRFLAAICEWALNLYVCRGGALWLAYHRTQTQSATQWECLFNPSTDIDSYYSYDTRTRQKCFIRTGYSFQPSIRLNSSSDVWSKWRWLSSLLHPTTKHLNRLGDIIDYPCSGVEKMADCLRFT